MQDFFQHIPYSWFYDKLVLVLYYVCNLEYHQIYDNFFNVLPIFGS